MANQNKVKIIAWGLSFLAIGALMLMDNLNLLPQKLPEYVISWKSLLVVLGLFIVIFRREAGGLLLVALGLYFILPEAMGMPIEDMHLFWPGIFIIIGLGTLMKLFPKKKKKCQEQRSYVSDTSDKESINYNVFFGGDKKQFSSYDFKGGRINVVCGGIEIDLVNCTLSKEHRIIDVSVVAGGIEMRVPKEWNIVMEVTPVMGGVEDNNHYSDAYIDPANQLTIRGHVVMGGIEIKRR